MRAEEFRRFWPLAVPILALLVILVVFSITQQQDPSIPKKIFRGEMEEPRIRVYVADTGVVESIPFEEYVAGVLGGEIDNDWPEESIKAQAILVRTSALKFIKERDSKHAGAHISTDIREAQAWNPQNVNERIRDAVNKTRGQVAVYRNEYINAWFHAHAGFSTATAKEGLNWRSREPAYINAVASPDAAEAPADVVHWKAAFSKQQVFKAVDSLGRNPGAINRVAVIERGPSGRATRLQVGVAEVSAPEFRFAIGSTVLKSTKINDLTLTDSEVIFSGTGYGHGVGMSQWGAYHMAELGASAEDIISYYFNGVRIAKLWN